MPLSQLRLIDACVYEQMIMNKIGYGSCSHVERQTTAASQVDSRALAKFRDSIHFRYTGMLLVLCVSPSNPLAYHFTENTAVEGKEHRPEFLHNERVPPCTAS